MGALYATLATELGWTYGDIDGLTMDELDELFEHWREQPPVPMLVRAYMGIGKKEKKRADRESLRDLAAMLGG